MSYFEDFLGPKGSTIGDMIALLRSTPTLPPKIEVLKSRSTGLGKSSFMRIDEFLKPLSFLDEAPKIYAPMNFSGDLLKTFSHPDYSACTVYVSLEKMDKRDPRNPNPEAGSTRMFYVTHNGVQKLAKNKTTALVYAERLHQRLVAETAARIAEEKRQFELAQQRQAEEARLNHEHLVSLPNYGGF